ncbi:MAG: hypothetical protein ACYDC2_08755 [Solirubrobacteraceae bacterium]
MRARAQVTGEAAHHLPGEILDALGDDGCPHAGRDALGLGVVAAPDDMAVARPGGDTQELRPARTDDGDVLVAELQYRHTKTWLGRPEQGNRSSGIRWQQGVNGLQQAVRAG